MVWIIHFELIFISCKRRIQFHYFTRRYSLFVTPFVEEIIFFPIGRSWRLCWKSVDSICKGFSGFSVLLHWCICLSLHHTILFDYSSFVIRESDGTPLQYSCLENTMDRGAWRAAVHGVAKSRTRLSDFTFTFHFHALEKEMATHSSVLAWRIPRTGEPGGLLSMGSHRVRHDWSDLAAAAAAL